MVQIMSSAPNPPTEPEVPGQQEAVKFLEHDFNQCFTQMRHYDAQIWETCKFTFTAYTTLLGVSVALYQYSIDKHVNLIPAAIMALFVGLVVGVLLLSFTVRNRVYFVVVTRYVNEHRRLFLSHKPLGFQNVTRMYTNPNQPPFFDPASSQSWICYTIAGLNSLLVALLTFILFHDRTDIVALVILAFVIPVAVQLIAFIEYLRTREGKSAGHAVFGKE